MHAESNSRIDILNHTHIVPSNSARPRSRTSMEREQVTTNVWSVDVYDTSMLPLYNLITTSLLCSLLSSSFFVLSSSAIASRLQLHLHLYLQCRDTSKHQCRHILSPFSSPIDDPPLPRSRSPRRRTVLEELPGLARLDGVLEHRVVVIGIECTRAACSLWYRAVQRVEAVAAQLGPDPLR